MIHKIVTPLVIVGILVHAATARAQMSHMHDSGACADGTLACAKTASPAFDGKGRLWLVWADKENITLARSSDLGAHFDAPVRITPAPEKIDSGPDARPQVSLGTHGQVTVAYGIFKDANYNGEIRLAFSQNDGKSFSVPRPLAPDSPSQRFVALARADDNRVFAAWIDKRESAVKPDFVGASVYTAWLPADGRGPIAARAVAQNSCECCRIGLALADSKHPVLLWRHVFDGTVRDHAVLTFVDRDTPGPIHRVSTDEWHITACPHHGPSLSIAEGIYHAAWFTQGQARKGLFYAHSTDGGVTFSEPMALGNAGQQTSRPQVLAIGNVVWLAWKTFDGTTTTIDAMVSRDGGKTWGASETVAQTSDASDHPILIARKTQPFLSWLTRREGYRLISLEKTGD